MSVLRGLHDEYHSSDCTTHLPGEPINTCRFIVSLEWYFLARGWGAEVRTETVLETHVL